MPSIMVYKIWNRFQINETLNVIMKPPTIRDVAKLAGVGVGTVSRVLNDSSQVREETRQKVLAAIKVLNFSPNLAARQLSSGKTGTIGVVTPFLTFPSYVDRLTGIQDVLDESEYDLVLYSIRSVEQLQRRLQILIGENRVDGLIILSLPFSEDKLRAINPTFPIIAVDNDVMNYYPHIIIDNVEGGELATNYLIERGHQFIGFIGDRINSAFGFTSTEKRFEGYERALAQADLPFVEEWYWVGEHSHEAARQNARRILSLPERPTAFFVAIDTLAFGVLTAAQDLGLRVPEDVAVIGFDDVVAASYMNLTTIRQGLVESGRLSVQQMLEWLEQGQYPYDNKKLKLPLEIVERATV
ncbi:MAG: LacI family DNA-binding transcriptional regulator [Anaerolineae bacterium]|nr:LacI family DNA-binding transcriptional regulator [Anaerolineae bacterium]